MTHDQRPTTNDNLPGFSNGTITMKFKTISGDPDRASGILFNVKTNGDWLAIRSNDIENNVALPTIRSGSRQSTAVSGSGRTDSTSFFKDYMVSTP
jgi:hypothetical protein